MKRSVATLLYPVVHGALVVPSTALDGLNCKLSIHSHSPLPQNLLVANRTLLLLCVSKTPPIWLLRNFWTILCLSVAGITTRSPLKIMPSCTASSSWQLKYGCASDGTSDYCVASHVKSLSLIPEGYYLLMLHHGFVAGFWLRSEGFVLHQVLQLNGRTLTG